MRAAPARSAGSAEACAEAPRLRWRTNEPSSYGTSAAAGANESRMLLLLLLRSTAQRILPPSNWGAANAVNGGVMRSARSHR